MSGVYQNGYYYPGYYWYYYPTNVGLPTGAMSPEGFPDVVSGSDSVSTWSTLPVGSMNPQGFPDNSGAGMSVQFQSEPLPRGSMNPNGFPSPVVSIGSSYPYQPGMNQSNFGAGLGPLANAFMPTVRFQPSGGMTIGPSGTGFNPNARFAAPRGVQGMDGQSSLFSNPLVIVGAIVLLAMALKGSGGTHHKAH